MDATHRPLSPAMIAGPYRPPQRMRNSRLKAASSGTSQKMSQRRMPSTDQSTAAHDGSCFGSFTSR